jgi:hypothetical protein
MRALPAALLTLLAANGTASAYVRARTDGGVPVRWPGDCVFMRPDSAGSPDLPDSETFATLEATVEHNWNDPLAGMSYIDLHYETPAALEATLDGINIIKFRHDVWCHGGDPNDTCYSTAATAITSVLFVEDGHKGAGTILDADIEMNDVNFIFTNLPEMPSNVPVGRDVADLANTLTHELGHVLGLDHTCSTAGVTPASEVDDSGNFPPACDALAGLPADEQQKIETATMFPTYSSGEISKRTPHPDDLAGVVVDYPTATDPNVCKHADVSAYTKGSCAMAPNERRPGALALLLPAFMLLLRRRWRLRNLRQRVCVDHSLAG